MQQPNSSPDKTCKQCEINPRYQRYLICGKCRSQKKAAYNRTSEKYREYQKKYRQRPEYKAQEKRYSKTYREKKKKRLCENNDNRTRDFFPVEQLDQFSTWMENNHPKEHALVQKKQFRFNKLRKLVHQYNNLFNQEQKII